MGWEDLLADTDIAILSMANFINPYTDVSAEAETLERSNAKSIVLIGCGAQAASYNADLQLRPDTHRFLSIVSERSKSIGVRGQYTAEILNRAGFKNVQSHRLPFLLVGSQGPRDPQCLTSAAYCCYCHSFWRLPPTYSGAVQLRSATCFKICCSS